MAFQTKTWKQRLTEYPTRRTLTKSDDSTEVVTVSRNEGDVIQEGDAFSPENMNDLENRIASAFSDLNSSLNELIVSCTQAEYDAMASHNPTTLYVITGD